MSITSIALFLRKVRVAITPRSWILTTCLDNGAVVSGLNRQGWGGRGVYVQRDSIEPELALMVRLLSAGEVVIDIGANVGVYTFSAARKVGSLGTVIAVEPFPSVYHHLGRNLLLNQAVAAAVRLRSYCVSDQTGPCTLWMNMGRPHSFSLSRSGDVTGLSLLKVSLDDLVCWEKLEKLNYIKIDAEGEEEKILNGGIKCINRFRPILQLEGTHQNLPPSMTNYIRFVSNGLNCLLIPSENTFACDTATELGWRIV